MSQRDRKRVERRKRKQRSGARMSDPGETNGHASEPEGSGEQGATDIATEAEAQSRGVSKSELRNQQAREELEALGPNERPLVVTIGAIVSVLVALSIVIAWLAGAETRVFTSGVETGSERPNAFQVFAPALLFSVMAWGMWNRRYWAVLGFQAVMAIIMIGGFLALITASSVFQALGVLLVLLVAATLFWFTVKALARIQMPDRHLPS